MEGSFYSIVDVLKVLKDGEKLKEKNVKIAHPVEVKKQSKSNVKTLSSSVESNKSSANIFQSNIISQCHFNWSMLR